MNEAQHLGSLLKNAAEQDCKSQHSSECRQN
uniref:Uncharacterized protein n=1 Tax=Arundo donax TaxID=35708 RepID=A0A0A8YQL1_ARUDO